MLLLAHKDMKILIMIIDISLDSRKITLKYKQTKHGRLFLFPLDYSIDRTLLCTRTAIHTEKRINVIFFRTFANCIHWTLIFAGPARNTIIGNTVRHFFSAPYLHIGPVISLNIPTGPMYLSESLFYNPEFPFTAFVLVNSFSALV